MTEFHNPYNFVPVGRPDKIGRIERSADGTVTNPLGQGEPVGHHRYHPGHWTGWIEIQIEVVTPLLIPDAARMQTGNKDHKTFDVRTGPDGKALLPVTTLKGALRSSYEAITNSRFGIFGNERKVPPARRMRPQEALGLVPVRITSGTTVAEQLHIAQIRQYEGNAINYPDGSPPSHGDHVECIIESWKKDHPQRPYTYFKVLAIGRLGDTAQLTVPSTYKRNIGAHHCQPTPNRQTITGWVFKTRQSIKFKHDERVFFQRAGAPLSSFAVTESHALQWRRLIEDYKAVFARDGKNANAPEPASYTQDGYSSELADGQLCFATTEVQNGSRVLRALYPAMIGRELGQASPWQLLDEKFRPVAALDQLSPADRVFGWVRQGGHGAHKGQLRIHSIACTSPEDGIGRPQGGGALTLPILSTPKPSQARFYLGLDADGTPLKGADDTKTDGYFAKVANGQPKTSWRLRGRKVYPHHRVADPIANVPPGLAPSNQNRSVKEWVKTGTTFSAKIDVINLNGAELGALLWLLNLPKDAHLRVGGGKPLGFGSVRITITGSQLRSGEILAAAYKSLAATQGNGAFAQETIRSQAIKAFTDAIAPYGSGTFAQAPFIQAFLYAAEGFADGHLTHYPRLTNQQPADGQNYEWFVANNRLAKPWSLGALKDGDKPALPRALA